MNMQTRPQGGFASNIWLQIAVVILIGLATKYIW
jgi:hypothetical protein